MPETAPEIMLDKEHHFHVSYIITLIYFDAISGTQAGELISPLCFKASFCRALGLNPGALKY